MREGVECTLFGRSYYVRDYGRQTGTQQWAWCEVYGVVGHGKQEERTCAGMVQVYGALFGYYERGGRDEGRES